MQLINNLSHALGLTCKIKTNVYQSLKQSTSKPQIAKIFVGKLESNKENTFILLFNSHNLLQKCMLIYLRLQTHRQAFHMNY